MLILMFGFVPCICLARETAHSIMFTKLSGNTIVPLSVEIPETTSKKLILIVEAQNLCNPQNKRLYVELFIEELSQKYNLGNFSFFGNTNNLNKQAFVFLLKEVEQKALRQGAEIKAAIRSFDTDDTDLSKVNLELKAKIDTR